MELRNCDLRPLSRCQSKLKYDEAYCVQGISATQKATNTPNPEVISPCFSLLLIIWPMSINTAGNQSVEVTLAPFPDHTIQCEGWGQLCILWVNFNLVIKRAALNDKSHCVLLASFIHWFLGCTQKRGKGAFLTALSFAWAHPSRRLSSHSRVLTLHTCGVAKWQAYKSRSIFPRYLPRTEKRL